MSIVPGSAATPTAPPTPTHLAGLPALLAYAQALDLDQHLDQPKRGVPTLTLALAWLALAWLGSGRPAQFEYLAEPLLATLLGCARLPCQFSSGLPGGIGVASITIWEKSIAVSGVERLL